MQLKSLFYFASAFTLAFTADVNDVQADLNVASVQLTALNNGFNDFPILGVITALPSALALYTSAVIVSTMLDKATADVNTLPTPVADADGTQLFTTVQNMQTTTKAALTTLTNRKNSFLGFMALVPGLSRLNPIRMNLVSLNASTTALSNALIAHAPASLKTQSIAVQADILGALAGAIAAFQ